MEDPVAPKLMLVGERVQVRPGADTLDVKTTVPVKLFWAVTVIVEVPAAPAKTVTAVGLAADTKFEAPPTL